MNALFHRLGLRARFGSTIKIRSGTYISKDVEIGAYGYIGRRCDISAARIGRFVSIGNNVGIGLGEHPIELLSTSHHFHRVDSNKAETRCEIGADVWIGASAIVRRGTKIGIGAIVGANSFVNRDVPDYAIFAGSPARLIRYRFDTDTIAHLLASRWWESDLDEAHTKVNALSRWMEAAANGQTVAPAGTVQ